MGIQCFSFLDLGGAAFARCGGGRFRCGSTVAGMTDAFQGVFDVFLRDDDGGADTQITDAQRISVGGSKRFRRDLEFFLSCDAVCDVQGMVKGTAVSTNENPAQVYAQAIEIPPTGKTPAMRKSTPYTYTCVAVKDGAKFADPVARVADPLGPGEDGLWEAPCFTLPVSGGSCATLPDVVIDLPARAVDRDLLLPVSKARPLLPAQDFPEDIGMTMRTLQIGRLDTVFHKDIAVRWKLGGGERKLLRELEGMVVRFDPEDVTWKKLDAVDMDDEAVRFTTATGGVFAIAANARYDDTQALFAAEVRSLF